MSLRKTLVVTLALCVLCPLAMAQNTNLVTAGIDPLTNNVDVYPGFWPIDNKGSNFDVECIGRNPSTTNEEFVIYGVANDSQCGPKKSIFDKNGLILSVAPGLLDDSGGDFITPGAAVGYGSVGGFGWRGSLGADPNTGEFIVHQIFFNNDVDFPFTNVAALVYGEAFPNHFNDHGLFQRFDRSGNKVSNVTCGRNIPSAVSHTDGVNFKANNQGSRSGGTAILSNGNSLFYLNDRSRDSGTFGDPSVLRYYKDVVPVFNPATTTNDGNRVNVHTVANAAASSFVVTTTPTFYNTSNHTTAAGDTNQGACAGEGWFACRVDRDDGSIAVFRNNGTRIAQIFGLKALYEANDALTLNAGDILTPGNRMALAGGANILYYGSRFQANGVAPQRPCILKFLVDTVGGTVTAQKMLTPDDDFAVAAAGDVHPDSIDLDSNIHGDLVVCWRKHPSEPNGGGAPVARVYNDDGTAETTSFYPSAIAAPDTDVATAYDADQADVKGAVGDNTIAVAWFTMNGLTPAELAAADCGGQPRAVGVAARVFQASLTDVQDWDIY
ncbi:MAG: hypothetical protein GHCLOJNM_01135 [bacterium]|nr:hypothetical protein [bacterium]